MFKKLSIAVSATFIAFFAFLGTAFAANVATGDEESLLDLAKPILEAVKGGDYFLAAACALILGAAALRKYGAKRWPFFATKPGGALLMLLASFSGALATSATAGEVPSAGLAWAAFKVSIAAAGGYSLISVLVIDPLRPWMETKAPAWLRTAFNALAWVFTAPTNPALEEATKAGDEAVKANPAPGTKPTLGEPTDVE